MPGSLCAAALTCMGIAAQWSTKIYVQKILHRFKSQLIPDFIHLILPITYNHHKFKLTYHLRIENTKMCKCKQLCCVVLIQLLYSLWNLMLTAYNQNTVEASKSFVFVHATWYKVLLQELSNDVWFDYTHSSLWNGWVVWTSTCIRLKVFYNLCCCTISGTGISYSGEDVLWNCMWNGLSCFKQAGPQRPGCQELHVSGAMLLKSQGVNSSSG